VNEFFLYSIGLVFLLAISAFFSGSEAAIYSLSRTRIRVLGERSTAGRHIRTLLENPRKLLVTILLGNLLVNIFTTSTATAILIDLFGEKGVGYAFVGMSLMIMVFGEILPKTVALHWSERLALFAIVPLRVFHIVVAPVRAPLSAFTDTVVTGLRKLFGLAKTHLTPEELVTAADVSRTSGAMGLFEFEVLSNVLGFREKVVKEIMTPSINVVSRPTSDDRSQLVRTFLESGISRLPIWGETPDDIVGILHIKDLLGPVPADDEWRLEGLLREPFYIPETAPIAELYKNLQDQAAHIAVVIDEYASFVGIVTTEDILEELVGEIRDARDSKVESHMRLDDDRIIVAGTMEIDEFNRIFPVRIEDDENDTVAGHVTGFTGKIPREGEVFEHGDMRFYIISAQPNRIRKLRIERKRNDE
jgi:putative hemolysin